MSGSGAIKRMASDSALQSGVLNSTRRASFGRKDVVYDTPRLTPVDCTMNTRKNSFSQVLSRNCLTPQEPISISSLGTPSSPMPIRRSRLSSFVKESPFLLHIRKDSLQHHRDASPIYQRYPESPNNNNRISSLFSPLFCASPIKFDLSGQEDSPRPSSSRPSSPRPSSPRPSSPLSLIKRPRSRSFISISSTEHLIPQDTNDANIPKQSCIPFQCLSPCCENKDEGFLFHFDTEGFPLSQKKTETSLHDEDDDKNNNNYCNDNRNKRTFDDLDNTPTKIPKIIIKSPADKNEDSDNIICSPNKLMSSYSSRGFSSVLMSVTKGNSPIGTNLSYLKKSPMNATTVKKTNFSTHRRGSLQPHLLHTPTEKSISVSYNFPHAGVRGLGVQRNHSAFTESLHLSSHKKRQSICPSSLSHLQSKTCGSQFQDDLGTLILTLQEKIKAVNKGFQPKNGCILGRGGFGVVKMGLFDGKFVAIKVIHGSRAASSACHEKLALNIPPHPHVVSTYAFVRSMSRDTANIYWKTGKKHQKDCKISREELKTWFSLPLENLPDVSFDGLNRESEWVWIVSELCTPLTLQSLINMSNLKFTLRDKIKLLGEMTSGVSHLHSLGLNHLDLKPSNALIAYDGKVKIADFGCCSPTNDHMGEPVIGTVAYQAPEVLIGGCGTNASDIFSLGVTIWHLVVGKFPYYGIHPHVVLYQVTRLNQRPNSLMCFSPRPSSLLEDLLLRIAERCWTTDPSARPTACALCRSLAALYLSQAM